MRKIIALIIGMTIALSACSSGTAAEKLVTNDIADSNNVIQTLTNAETIEMKKQAISWSDKWTIYADGEEIAKVEGRPLYIIGDTYSMFSNNGNFVGAESENFRIAKRTAEVYNYNSEEVGKIEKEIFTFLAKYVTKDNEGNVSLTAEQKFNIALTMDINDSNGENVCKLKKDIFSIGSKLTLTCNEISEDDIMNAVWMSLIANEVAESTAKKSDSK